MIDQRKKEEAHLVATTTTTTPIEVGVDLHDVYQHLCDIDDDSTYTTTISPGHNITKLTNLLERLPKEISFFVVPLENYYTDWEFQMNGNGFRALKDLDHTKAITLDEACRRCRQGKNRNGDEHKNNNWQVMTAHVTRMEVEKVSGLNYHDLCQSEIRFDEQYGKTERVFTCLNDPRTSNGSEFKMNDDGDDEEDWFDRDIVLESIDEGGLVLLPADEMIRWWGEGSVVTKDKFGSISSTGTTHHEEEAEGEEGEAEKSGPIHREINYWTSTLVVMRSSSSCYHNDDSDNIKRECTSHLVDNDEDSIMPPKKKARNCSTRYLEAHSNSCVIDTTE